MRCRTEYSLGDEYTDRGRNFYDESTGEDVCGRTMGVTPRVDLSPREGA